MPRKSAAALAFLSRYLHMHNAGNNPDEDGELLLVSCHPPDCGAR